MRRPVRADAHHDRHLRGSGPATLPAGDPARESRAGSAEQVEQSSRQVRVGRATGAVSQHSWVAAAVSCAALLFAFLPVLADLARHLAETPWARYSALFPLLAGACVLREREPRQARRDAALWILAGLVVLLLGHFMGAVRWGRVGAALAAIGLCRRFGWGSWRSQALLLFAVPLPAIALRIAQPLSQQLLTLSGLLVGWLGVDVAPVAIGRPGSGLPLVPLLAGLAWYAALRRQLPLRPALTRTAGAALLAFPIQLLATALAALAASAVGADAARAALIHAPWLVVALLGVAHAERAAAEPVPS